MLGKASPSSESDASSELALACNRTALCALWKWTRFGVKCERACVPTCSIHERAMMLRTLQRKFEASNPAARRRKRCQPSCWHLNSMDGHIVKYTGNGVMGHTLLRSFRKCALATDQHAVGRDAKSMFPGSQHLKCTAVTVPAATEEKTLSHPDGCEVRAEMREKCLVTQVHVPDAPWKRLVANNKAEARSRQPGRCWMKKEGVGAVTIIGTRLCCCYWS